MHGPDSAVIQSSPRICKVIGPGHLKYKSPMVYVPAAQRPVTEAESTSGAH